MNKHSATGLHLAISVFGTFGSLATAQAGLIVNETGNYKINDISYTVAPDPDGNTAGGLDAAGNPLTIAAGGNGLPATNVGGNPTGTSVGLRNTYNSQISAVAGLSYTNPGGTLVTSNNSLKRISGTGFGNVSIFPYRFMTTDPFQTYRSTASGNLFGWNGSYATELYYSVLLNWNAINTGSDNRLVVGLGRDNGGFNTYLSQNGTNWAFGDQLGNGFVFGPATANETVLIVCRLAFESATSFTTNYWFNPTLGQSLGVPSYSRTYTTSVSGGQFQSLNVRDGANILTFDEFRLGTTATSVMPVVGAVAPTAPSTLVATANSFSEVGLTWADNSNNEIDFVLERSLTGTGAWRQVAVLAAGTTSYADSGLNAVTTYHYRILAANGGGESAYSANASVTTPSAAVPTAPPSGLTGVADSFSEITLSWNDNTIDETSFVIERSPNGTTEWALLATLPTDTTGYQDLGLTASTAYSYRVYANAPGGASVPSNIATITTLVLPDEVPLEPISLPFSDADGATPASTALVDGITAYSGSGFIRTTSALSYPGISSSGNGLETVSGQRYYFSIDTSLPGLARYVSGGQIGGSGLGVLYVRWLARGINAQEGNTVDFRTAPNDVGANSRAAVGTTFGFDFIRAMASSTATSGITTYNTSVLAPSAGTDLYVAKFTFTPSGVTTMNVFVNQLTEGTPDASVNGAIKFNTIGFSKFGTGPIPSIDEFRIGTSYTAVVGDTPPGGTYAPWAFANGVIGGLQGDSDTDGVTNAMEYALQSNLTGSDGSLGTFTGGLMNFIKRQAAIDNNDITYIIETSPSLLPPWTPQVTHGPENNETGISYLLPPGGGKLFGRLRIVVTE